MLLRQSTIHLKEIAHEIEKTTPVLDFLSTACAGQYTGLDLPWKRRVSIPVEWFEEFDAAINIGCNKQFSRILSIQLPCLCKW